MDDARPHVKIKIHWKSSDQEVRTLVDTGAEATLIYGNPAKFKGPIVSMTGLGGQVVTGVQVNLFLTIGQLPKRQYPVVITPVKEWIIGMDILRGMTLHLDHGKYQFGVRKVAVGKVLMKPFPIPEAGKVVCLKQYRIPGGQKRRFLTLLKIMLMQEC